MIEEKRRELEKKYQLLKSGIEVLEKMTLPQMSYHVFPIKDHVRQLMLLIRLLVCLKSLINLVNGPLSLQSDDIKDHCYTIPIKVMESWQRIVDDDIWSIGLVVKNEGDM